MREWNRYESDSTLVRDLLGARFLSGEDGRIGDGGGERDPDGRLAEANIGEGGVDE